MRVLDLFSGIGGFSLGLERAGMTTAAFCEIEEFPRAVLAKHWPDVPIYDDVRTLTADRLARDGVGRIDLVCGGYPCQPFSHAGKRAGAADDRHLWPEMRRVVGEVRPAWVVAENVAGHISMGLDQVLADLEADGYAGRAIVVPAAAVDAPHIRQRVWIVARDRDRDREPACAVDAEMEGMPSHVGDTNGADGERGTRGVSGAQAAVYRAGEFDGCIAERPQHAGEGRGARALADADLAGLEGRHGAGVRERRAERAFGTGGSPLPGTDRQPPRRATESRGQRRQWCPEPAVGRVAHGVPARVDRLRALGNAVVPQVVEEIGRAIMRDASGSGASRLSGSDGGSRND